MSTERTIELHLDPLNVLARSTALAFYYLWLTGELMIHHRQGFERMYDFRGHIAPSSGLRRL